LRSTLDGRTLIEYAAGDDRLHAFVLKDGALRFVDLGARRPIEGRVQDFLDDISDESRLAGPAEVARTGGDLYTTLLSPLALDTDRIVVVPCGDLARLPFEALVVSAPEGAKSFDDCEFVLDRLDVAYAPSCAALAALAQRPRALSAHDVLLLGDPVYAT